MEMLDNGPVTTGRRRGVARMKKHNLKTDMTPMVDLGFLLIAFFVMTTQLNKPVVARLNMPHDGPPMPLPMKDALTMIIDKENTVYYYAGQWEEAIKNHEIFQTSFAGQGGIGDIIREKQKYLGQSRDNLMLLIKATKKANYGDVIKALDETMINNVKKYAIVKPEKAELDYITTSATN